MARLWRNDPETPEGKYLVVRRDGTIPPWPSFVLGGGDEASVAGLLAYADKAEELGYDPDFVADIRGLAVVFDEYRAEHAGESDADAPRHRVDDPATIERMRKGKSG